MTLRVAIDETDRLLNDPIAKFLLENLVSEYNCTLELDSSRAWKNTSWFCGCRKENGNTFPHKIGVKQDNSMEKLIEMSPWLTF